MSRDTDCIDVLSRLADTAGRTPQFYLYRGSTPAARTLETGEDGKARVYSPAEARALLKRGRRIGVRPESVGMFLMDFDLDDERHSRDALDFLLAPFHKQLPDVIATIHGSKSPGHLHAWLRTPKHGLDPSEVKDGAKIHFRGFHVGEYKVSGIVPLYLPEAFEPSKMSPDCFRSLSISYSKLFDPPANKVYDTGQMLAEIRDAAKGMRRATMKAAIFRLVSSSADATANIDAVIEAYTIALSGEVAPEKARKDVEGVHQWAKQRIKPKAAGTYPYTVAGLAAILEHLNIRVRYNDRASQTEIRHATDDWQPYGGTRDRNRLMSFIETRCHAMKGDSKIPWSPPYCRFEQLFDALTDPVDPYLESLESFEFNGKPLIDTPWLSLAFDTSDNDPDLVLWASRQMIMAPILRAVRPGAKVDETVILVGDQGIGKSSAVRALVPEARYMGDFSLGEVSPSGTGHRDLIDRLTRYPIAEVAEMVGIREKLMAQCNAFMTRQEDSYAPKYQGTRQIPRRFVFIGTANPGHAVPDDFTGNRRWVPIKVSLHKDATGEPGAYASTVIASIRDQLLAEGLRRIRAGESVHLPQALKKAQQTAFDSVAEKHPLDDAIAEIEASMIDDCPKEGFSVFRIAEIAKLTTRKVLAEGGETEIADPAQRLPKSVQMDLAKVLRERGWKKKHTDRGNRWFPPEIEPGIGGVNAAVLETIDDAPF